MSNPIVIEIVEKTLSNGKFLATIVSPELKASGSTCIVRHEYADCNGRDVWARKTCNSSAGSTRYTHYHDLETAYAEARKWAERKIRAHRREQGAASAAIIARFARLLATGHPYPR